MRRNMLLLALLTGALLAPLVARAAFSVELKSVNVDLPQSDRLFTGEGADVLNSNCLACHSAGMVLNQPALTRATWQAEVNKMIQSYKAPISGADVAAIVEYLTRTKGAGS
jgi:mono/diheme cytochrome c family protein